MTKEISIRKASTPNFFDFFKAAIKLIVCFAQLAENQEKEKHPKQQHSFGQGKESKSMSKPRPKRIKEDVFPTIPEVATEFIKRNGFQAQDKRQNDDFISCGVTVKEVKEHLMKVIPGLADNGISDNAVRFVFRFDIINFIIL